jgi:hypothetical protein
MTTRALAIAAAFWVLSSACGGNAECDKASLAGVCDYGTSGSACVDFSGLSTADSKSAQARCAIRGGVWGTGPCPTGGVGTCNLPPTAANIDISCSAHGVIIAHYYGGTAPSAFTTATAQATCAAVKGATFTAD